MPQSFLPKERVPIAASRDGLTQAKRTMLLSVSRAFTQQTFPEHLLAPLSRLPRTHCLRAHMHGEETRVYFYVRHGAQARR